jgi:CheY-like chemotaxis protein
MQPGTRGGRTAAAFAVPRQRHCPAEGGDAITPRIGMLIANLLERQNSGGEKDPQQDQKQTERVSRMDEKQKKIKVLVIDDNKDLCLIIKEYMERTGRFEVPIFTSAKAGIKYAKAKKADIILLDLMMPEMDGTQAAEQLLEDENTRDIPIIFITAAIKKSEVEERYGYIQGHPILAKPILPGQIIKKIENVLGLRDGALPILSDGFPA